MAEGRPLLKKLTPLLIVLGSVVVANLLGLVILALVRHWWPVSRIADQGLAISLVVMVISWGVAQAWLSRDQWIRPKFMFAVLTALVSGLFFLQFALGAPLNVDRSRSFHVLAWVSSLEPTTVDEVLLSVREKQGPVEEAAIRQRLDEHVERGLIEVHDGKLSLTSGGEAIVRGSELVAKIFELQGWNEQVLNSDQR